MIGNDVVDLQMAKQAPKSTNQRWLNKVFSPKEQLWVGQQSDQEQALWAIWALKESAYKLSVRLNPSLTFHPKKFYCNWQNSRQCFGSRHAIIRTPSGFVDGYVQISTHYIHAHCKLTAPQTFSTYSSVFQLSDYKRETQSTEVRHYLMQWIQRRLKLKASELKVIKSSKGIPEIYFGAFRLPLYISLSHHGFVGAFSVTWNKESKYVVKKNQLDCHRDHFGNQYPFRE